MDIVERGLIAPREGIDASECGIRGADHHGGIPEIGVEQCFPKITDARRVPDAQADSWSSRPIEGMRVFSLSISV